MKLITSVRPMRTQRSKMICIQFTGNRSFTRRTTTSRGRTCRSHQSSRTNIYLTEYHSLLPLGCGMIAFCVHIVSKYVYTFFSAYLLTGIKSCEEIFFLVLIPATVVIHGLKSQVQCHTENGLWYTGTNFFETLYIYRKNIKHI